MVQFKNTRIWANEIYEIPNFKNQITNKSQISIINDRNICRIYIALSYRCKPSGIDSIPLNVWMRVRFEFEFFGHCDLFEFWYLVLGIYNTRTELEIFPMSV
jgi:hypothetical protein